MAFAPRGPMNQPTVVPPSNQAAVVNALEPGMVMHGNQPGVARANPDAGTMQVQTNFNALGPDRYTTTSTPPAPGGASVQGQRLGAEIPGAGNTSKGWGTSPLEGYNPDKIARDHSSPKYQVGQVMSNADLSRGITPEFLASLQALGLGDVRQLSKDKVEFYGNVDPRFEGYTIIDLMRGANGPGGAQAWQYGAQKPGEAAQQAAAPQVAGGGMGGGFASASGGVNGLLGGNPYQGITDALGKLTQGGQVNIEALIRQLQGV